MARYVSDSCFIASIYPGELWPIYKNVGPRPEANSPRRTTYKLKPVKRGEQPYVIEVSDGFENIHDPMASHVKKDQWRSKIVDCKEIRENLIREWAGSIYDCPPGASIGVMAIAGLTPTDEEVSQMLNMQTAFAEWSFQRGEECVKEKTTKEIRGIWRTMAIWLGRKTTNNWATPAQAAHDVNCVWCQTLISPTARVCATCGREQEEPEDGAPEKRRPGRPRKVVEVPV